MERELIPGEEKKDALGSSLAFLSTADNNNARLPQLVMAQGVASAESIDFFSTSCTYCAVIKRSNV